ncbi:hypothetical protein [Maritimibacter sp. UBA3975]|uniref:hypothetical protein n=1 Tax=Maritimibacter sp. UBA3975 TaxID=1946833 RepID=UPI0025C6F6B6|nr:hypothetical protein [Maritimibacter sp. UBA3975]
MEREETKVAFGPYSRIGLAAVFLPLYGGPVLSGWAGHPLTTLPVFALTFLLFIAATRRPHLDDAGGRAALVLMAVVQVVLASACFAAGRWIGLVAGPLALTIWLPIALSAVAALVGAWRYSDSAEMDVFLDGAIDRLNEIDRGLVSDWTDIHPEPAAATTQAVERALSALAALPRDARAGQIDPVVQRLEREAGIAAFDPLYDAAGEVDGTEDPRIDRALLRFVASPRIRRQLVERGEGAMAAMLLLNAADAGVRFEARSLLLTLIDEGVPVDQLPDPVWLDELSEAFPGEGYDEIARLRG